MVSLLSFFQVATVQFTSEVFSGNETFGYADILVILTGVLEDPTSVRYVDFICWYSWIVASRILFQWYLSHTKILQLFYCKSKIVEAYC